MTHRLLVSSADNFETRRRKSALHVKPGDTVFYYLTKVKSIGGESVVTGEMYEDREPIWESNKPDEDYQLIHGLL